MKENCIVCERINQILSGSNPYFVKELETGYVVLGDYQYFKGYTLFLCKLHHAEVHQLKKPFRQKFLEEMSIVSEAVWNWIKPEKLNYEALGNSADHFHWHIFPRHNNEPFLKYPVWQVPLYIRNADKYKPDHEELIRYRSGLIYKLEELI